MITIDYNHDTARCPQCRGRWTPSLGCWQAFRNSGAIFNANRIAKANLYQ